MARGLRVIAGSAGGLRLVAPKGARTRPTTDRVKESVFASLGPDTLEGATVLDLYAGSGALAIEALSRGAGRALLVDDDPVAIDAIERNLGHTQLAERARARRADVADFLRGPLPSGAPFDVVFLDPPYDTPDDEVTRVLGLLVSDGWLAPPATVVVERPAGGTLAWPPGLALARERSYGDTVVLFASPRSTATTDPAGPS
ncbi:MAG: 16S rRNA (guanine(966)-N(2))-methyltransferase RsmD [Acidimicrobiia bacterium]